MRFILDLKPRFLVFLVFSFAVAGCEEKKDVAINSIAKERGSEHVSIGSVIYLAGGEGLEFGVRPIVDEVKADSRGIEHRSVIFEFSESLVDLYSSIDSVMKEQGYSSVESESNRYKHFVVYKKSGKSVAVGFNEKVSGGLSRSSSAAFWWRSEGGVR